MSAEDRPAAGSEARAPRAGHRPRLLIDDASGHGTSTCVVLPSVKVTKTSSRPVPSITGVSQM